MFRKPLRGCFRVGNKAELRGVVVDDFGEKWLSRWKKQTWGNPVLEILTPLTRFWLAVANFKFVLRFWP